LLYVLSGGSLCRAVAGAEGAAFWSSPSWYEEAVKLSMGLLEVEDRAVADAFAGLLGDLAAASHSQAAKDAVRFTLCLVCVFVGISRSTRNYVLAD